MNYLYFCLIVVLAAILCAFLYVKCMYEYTKRSRTKTKIYPKVPIAVPCCDQQIFDLTPVIVVEE